MLNESRDKNVSLFYSSKQVRVFVAGDYEFLCSIYGISGATGMFYS